MSLKQNLQLLKWQVEALNPCEYLSYCAELVRKFREEAIKFQEVEKLKRDLELINNKLSAENSSLVTRLNNARCMLEEELNKNSTLEKKSKLLENQINLIREVLFDKNKTLLNDEQKAKLSFLDIPTLIVPTTTPKATIPKREAKRSASLLAPFKYEATEDSLDPVALDKMMSEYNEEEIINKVAPLNTSNKKRPSDDEHGNNDYKKAKNNGLYPEIETAHNYELSGRKSLLNRSLSQPSLNNLDFIDVDTKGDNGFQPLIIESVHEEKLPTSTNIKTKTPARERSNTICNPTLSTWNSAGKLIKSRPHIFMIKSHFTNEPCGPCGKKIKFGSKVLKCRDCKATCHTYCQGDVPLPCIHSNTPKLAKQQNYHLTEFIPGNPPYIPAIVIHCIYAIECRGMKDVGLYRVPGSEKEVRELKEKFLKGKTPCLDKIMDINVICGCLKDFFRNLSEPLITRALWQEFVSSAGVKQKDLIKGTTLMCQNIMKLPVANRDTLSFLMLHLQKVAAIRENKMPISNLAMIFAPSIVGFSSTDPTPFAEIYDFGKQALVIEQMLTLPTEFWNQFIDTDALLTVEEQSPEKGSSNNDCDTPIKSRIGHSIKHPSKFFTSPRLFPH